MYHCAYLHTDNDSLPHRTCNPSDSARPSRSYSSILDISRDLLPLGNNFLMGKDRARGCLDVKWVKIQLQPIPIMFNDLNEYDH